MRTSQYPPHQRYSSEKISEEPDYYYYTTPTGQYYAYDRKSGCSFVFLENQWRPNAGTPPVQHCQQSRKHSRRDEYQCGSQRQPYGIPRADPYRSSHPYSVRITGEERNRGSMRRSRETSFPCNTTRNPGVEAWLDGISGKQDQYPLDAEVDNTHYNQKSRVRRVRGDIMSDLPLDRNHYEAYQAMDLDDEGVDVYMGDRAGRLRQACVGQGRQRSRSGPELRRDFKDSPYMRDASRHIPRQKYYEICHPYQHLRDHSFGSNQAAVGCEGSDHDSGFMDDSHHIEISRVPKGLHRQDSGIDMSGSAERLNIEIDVHMDEASEVGDKYPGPGCFPHGSPHPRYVGLHRATEVEVHSPTETYAQDQDEVQDRFVWQYEIPPCPDMPPLDENQVVGFLSETQIIVPRHLSGPQKSPSFYQPDSVYTASEAAGPTSNQHHYFPQVVPPRAPTPPVSPRVRRTVPAPERYENVRRYRW